jgi:acetyl-CoA carboxylase biotin carboxylase subunit
MPFSKILVANRGEIAIRIFRTCKARGIKTVAVYSEGDRYAPHVAIADEAVCIGPTPSSESYLNIENVLAAAKATGAQAIHPGYGFLSERAAFARACEKAGLILIGPPAKAMEIMGDKVTSRVAMKAAGVPVVPGCDDLKSVEQADAVAREIGFPLMIKASAGGGGKGMRLVTHASELHRAVESAIREAKSAFGDGRVFIERALMRARHIEIQLMADAHGNVVALNERDCSVQRRHQKVIEEAPSPCPEMTPEIRRAMGEVACRAAKAVDYRGAGTVEFMLEVVDGQVRYYFLEMNTRLQVEHPVTELTCERDLVWDQLRVAAGEELGLSQADVRLTGHAIECRLYAEDPLRFLPSPGRITRLVWPNGPGIRVDAAVVEGGEVSSHYDPMIAKVIAWGPDRESAICRMRQAMRETVILGIETNQSFHLRVLDEPDFVAGNFDTRYIQEHPGLVAEHSPSEREAKMIAASLAFARSRTHSVPALEAGTASPQPSPWQSSARWRH